MSSKRRGKSKIVHENKIALKKIFKAVLHSVVLVYIAFSIFSLSACSKKGEESFFDKQMNARGKIARALLQKYDAQMFPCSLQEIFSKPVIMDTVIIGIKENNGDYFIHAKVNTSCNKKYFANLKCDKEIIEQFNHTKSNYAFIAAKITKAIDYNLTAEADSLEGQKSQLNLGNAVLLNGECLALAEITPIINAN